MAHPEEPAAADAAAGDSSSKGEDEAIKKQLMESLGADEVPKLEVCSCILRLCAAISAGTQQHTICRFAHAFRTRPFNQHAVLLNAAVTLA